MTEGYITDKDKEEGYVEILAVYAYDGKCRGKHDNKVATYQGWVLLTQKEYDDPDILFNEGSPDRIQFWDKLEKHVSPGQTYRMKHNLEKQLIRGPIQYVGMWDSPKIVAQWRRNRDEFEQSEKERKLQDKDRKEDPYQQHFDALRKEYNKRHGAAQRHFLARLIYEITK